MNKQKVEKTTTAPSTGGISRFDHRNIEDAWRKQWEDVALYAADMKGSKPFYNLMMFPYPSAEGLHVGNMYAFTGSDIYGRFKRMQGYEVFEPIGLDGFGIHSENYAFKIGAHPMDQASISEEHYYRQLRRIGAMFDWSRTVETYDPSYYVWTQWLFVTLFKAGLAYRSKAQVNWCPSCKTVLADEQVIEETCERCGNTVSNKLLEQWFFRITAYAGKLLENIPSLEWSEKVKTAQKNWIGKKDGVVIHHAVEDMDITLDTFSAYPAWLFADTFIVIAPDHPKVIDLIKGTEYEKQVTEFITAYKAMRGKQASKTDEKEGVFTGRYVIDPFNKGARMPIWLANFALMDFGTGIIRCSAHDERDYEFARKYKINLKEVVDRIDPEIPINAHENQGALKDSGPFSGREIDQTLIENIVDWIAVQGFGKKQTTYHLRDWLVSRQRYWGPPIPMIYCQSCDTNHKGERTDMPGWWSVPAKDLPVLLPRIDDYKPGDDGIAPLAKHKEFYETTCPGCGDKAVRETDVSDTFLDSSWYFLRYPSTRFARSGQVPFDPEITKKWLPVHMYTGGAEHSVLHLLYSRFVTMALKDLGHIDFEEPFAKFFAHGLVIKEGAKMSKSKGNIINPDIYIDKYGIDSLRLYLMFMGPYSQGGDFRDAAMEGMSRWVGRVWRMALASINQHSPSSSATIYSALQKAIKKVGEDTEDRHYNTAIATMMEFTNFIADEGGWVGITDLSDFIKLLAPYAPFLSEELWSRRKQGADFSPLQVFRSRQDSVHLQPWPTFDPEVITEKTVTMVVQINGKLRDSFQLPHEISQIQNEVEKVALVREKIQAHIAGKKIRKTIFVPGRLINLVPV